MFAFNLNAKSRLLLRRADWYALLSLSAAILVTAGVTLDAAAALLSDTARPR